MTPNRLIRRIPGAREWTSCQRRVTALPHREPVRVPFDLGGSMVTGIYVRVLTALPRGLGLPSEVQVLDRVTPMADTGDGVRDRLHVDAREPKSDPDSAPQPKRTP